MSRSEYQEELGRRLRAVRTQQELTLQQVEERSDGLWKAVVIGAYERGDRAISAAKLADLAGFYGVPVTELMPPTAELPPAERNGNGAASIVLDLTRLSENGQELETVSRYASSIQRQRGDYNGRVLTIRRDDVRTLAAVLGTTTDDLLERLAGEGLIAGKN